MQKNDSEQEILSLKSELCMLKNQLRASQEMREVELMGLDSVCGFNVLEHINDVVFSLNQEGKILFVSASVFKCFGYTPEEVQGRYFVDFLPDHEVKRVSSLLSEAISSRQDELLFEFQFVTKSNGLICLAQNTSFLHTSSSEFFATAVARDITEEKKAKQELQKSESKYQRIIENMELGLMEVDLDGNITQVYDTFCKLTGYHKSELIGQKATDKFLPPEFEPLMKEQEEKRKRGEPEVYEVEMLTKNKERLVVLISGAPIYNSEEEIVGSIGIHYDITQRKKDEESLRLAHEETKEARKVESAFLAKISHEIRTPLNAIQGIAHLMSDSSLNKEQQAFIEDIKNSSNILKNLIADVLNVSTINSSSIKVTKEVIDLHDLLRVQQNIFQFNVSKKPIEVHLSIDESVPKFIVTDQALLDRSLMSIIGNAVKFTDAGLVEVSATMEYKNEATVLKIEVKDTGRGIDQEELPFIFDRFYQSKLENGQLPVGTGLGLNLALEFIKMLDGSIEVESTKGSGTLVSVILPAERASKPIKVSSEKSSCFSKRGKVLIVEDNELNRTYCSRLLVKWGVAFEIAKDGQEALDLLNEELFDLVLMDVQMPKLDGIEVTLQTRHFVQNDNRKTPIIGVSTFAQESEVNRALEAGMNDHIGKPYTPDELKEKLNVWLPNSTASTEMDQSTFEHSRELDGRLLKEFYNGDLDYMSEMFELFLLGFSGVDASIREAAQRKDFAVLQAITHKSKPTLTMIGMPNLTEELAEIESKAKVKDPNAFVLAISFLSKMPVVLKTIENESVRLKKHLKTKRK